MACKTMLIWERISRILRSDTDRRSLKREQKTLILKSLRIWQVSIIGYLFLNKTEIAIEKCDLATRLRLRPTDSLGFELGIEAETEAKNSFSKPSPAKSRLGLERSLFKSHSPFFWEKPPLRRLSFDGGGKKVPQESPNSKHSSKRVEKLTE